jgi:hypothetical protein
MFIGSIEAVCKNGSDVYSKLFRELCKDAFIKEAMIRGLNQRALRCDLLELYSYRKIAAPAQHRP